MKIEVVTNVWTVWKRRKRGPPVGADAGRNVVVKGTSVCHIKPSVVSASYDRYSNGAFCTRAKAWFQDSRLIH
jgi:hypothetical protein